MMNLDGSGIEQLVADDKPIRYPAWSADGKQFVFSTWRPGSPASALKSLFFVDIEKDQAARVDLDQVLGTLEQPWGVLNWDL